MSEPKRGYHLRDIPQGQHGEISKIQEELEELKEAMEQNNPVMALVEIADLYGAIELYLEKHHPSITMEHIKNMSEATKRSFLAGHRRSKS